jgi:YHS domain-containing protein
MALLSRIIRFLFWVVVISWGFRLVSKYITGLLQSGHPPETTQGRDLNSRTTSLVRDPICGVYVSEALALPLSDNGALLHFCSSSCREAYLQPSRKLAASG